MHRLTARSCPRPRRGPGRRHIPSECPNPSFHAVGLRQFETNGLKAIHFQGGDDTSACFQHKGSSCCVQVQPAHRLTTLARPDALELLRLLRHHHNARHQRRRHPPPRCSGASSEKPGFNLKEHGFSFITLKFLLKPAGAFKPQGRELARTTAPPRAASKRNTRHSEQRTDRKAEADERRLG